jgi:ATP-dependent exoDNAse (exonuclease V) beta subunit
MNQSRYLPNGFVSSLSKQETKLVNTVAEIAYKRRAAGLPAIGRIHSFCLQILKLAADYQEPSSLFSHLVLTPIEEH